MVLQGSGTLAPVDVAETSPDYPDWSWQVVAPAGGKACILHFVFQGDPLDAAFEARAQALRDLDGAALSALGLAADPLAGLSAEERGCIKNFNLTGP